MTKYLHELIQTGTHYDHVPVMPGHHETPETPITCLCCGKELFFRQPQCLCKHVKQWYEDALKNVACELHLQEKVKDGLFRT